MVLEGEPVVVGDMSTEECDNGRVDNVHFDGFKSAKASRSGVGERMENEALSTGLST